ncbi:hypothetical protein QBC44DRAFT_393049 [Cladorrhinum sp. PSN332]|nr:hypothetical protein QBC44DRAFT_393049 [Cladorrhinum sp. PSN332]
MQGNRQKSDGDGGGDGDGDGDEEEKGEEDNAENEEENLTRIVIRSRPPRPVRSTQPAIRKETSVRGTKTTCTTETTTTEPEAQSIAEANKSEDITVAEVASDDDEDPDPDSDDNDVDASSSSSDESFHGELNEPRIKYYTVNPLGIIIIPERGASSPPSSLIGTRLSPSPTPPDRAAQSEEGVMMAGPILPERRSSKYVVTGSIGSTGCESGGLGKEWTRGMSLLRLGTILEEEEEEEEENAGEGSGMTTACKHEEDKEEQDMTQPSDTSVSGAVEREESMPEILVRPERTWSRV